MSLFSEISKGLDKWFDVEPSNIAHFADDVLGIDPPKAQAVTSAIPLTGAIAPVSTLSSAPPLSTGGIVSDSNPEGVGELDSWGFVQQLLAARRQVAAAEQAQAAAPQTAEPAVLPEMTVIDRGLDLSMILIALFIILVVS